jgi:asparagine synthase (glutamine-hydrolysing)
MSGSTTKKLLRRMLRGRLPDSILDRPKKGFGAPMAHWFRTDLKPLLMDHLTTSRLVKEGFFNAKVVNQMIDAHMSYKADYRKELYSLLFFEMWLSRWVL